MKKYFMFAVLICEIFLSACGGGGGSATFSSGSVSVVITDAKPVLPTGVAKVIVTINEVSVHSSGGQWVSLPMAQTPFTIDLLQFTSGRTTQLVPQVALAPGKYTQVRLGIQSAMIVTDTGQQFPVEIASGDLKTDKNFDFDVTGGGAVALTVDFDLSQSLVVTGSGTYKLKPVLHLVNTVEAATITGRMDVAARGFDQAVIIVTLDNDNSGNLTTGDEEYTRLTITNGQSGPTPFSIYWLVPDQSYIVEVQVGGITVYSQGVAKTALPAGAVYPLNNGNPI